MPIADIDYHDYFTLERIEELHDIFAKYDTDGIGKIGESPLYSIIRKHFGLSLSRPQVRDMIGEVDYDGSGALGFEAFCMMIIKMNHMRPRSDLIDYRDYLDEKAIKKMEVFFLKCDRSGKGALGMPELEQILSLAGHKADEAKTAEIFEEVDKDGSGLIEFDEFLALWTVLTHCRKRINYREFLTNEQVAAYRKIFLIFDTSKDGMISGQELDVLLRRIGLVLSHSQVTKLLADFDPSHTGLIDFDNFCVMMSRLKGERKKREINPRTCDCEQLFRNECFTIKDLIMSGFSLRDMQRANIPCGQLLQEGEFTALDFRRAGYDAKTLRRAGLGVPSLRACGYSLTELRLAGFSDVVLAEANKLLWSALSNGDLTSLPQQRPSHSPCEGGSGAGDGFSKGISWGKLPPRPMTNMIRAHTDFRPKVSQFARYNSSNRMSLAANAILLTRHEGSIFTLAEKGSLMEQSQSVPNLPPVRNRK